MTFLAPFFLGLAALAGVPLLVHLLRRRITRRVEFPALRYLLQTQREHSRERTVRNRLLLLLRLLAVLALVAAVARPLASLGGTGHPPMALAVVLDQSMSTGAVVGGQTLLSGLQTAALQLVGELTPDDRGWLVTSGGRVATGDAGALQQAIADVTSAAGAGDLPGAIRRAVRLVEAGAPRTPVVVVITDGQPPVVDSAMEALGVPVVIYAPTVALPPNRTVHTVRVDPPRWVPAGRITATVSAADSAPWRVMLGDRTASRGTAPAAPFATPVTVEASAQVAQPGWMAGRVELDADDYPGDNARHFAVLAGAPPAVRVTPQSGPFAAAAVDALIADGRLRLAPPGAVGAVGIISASEAFDGSALRAAPTDPLELVAANRALERAGIPWRYGAALRDTVALSISSTAATATDSALAGAQVMLRYQLSRSPMSTESDSGVIVTSAGGTPWLVAGDRYVLLGSPLSMAATSVPLQAAFLPWLRDLIGQRLGGGGVLLHAAPDDTISVPAGADALQSPDGSVQPVAGAQLQVPATPGVYFVRRGTSTLGALVVNPELSESEVEAWGAGVWRAHITGTDVQTVSEASNVNRAVFNRSGGRPITWPLVFLAAVALALESLVARGLLSPRSAPVAVS